jgi:hypothetical protein
MSHTRGPWVAVPSGSRWRGEKPIFANGLWHILPEYDLERLPICEVDHADDHDEATREHAEEDARLISASPELLQACKVARLNIDGLEHNEEVQQVLAVLDAAISKAEVR